MREAASDWPPALGLLPASDTNLRLMRSRLVMPLALVTTVTRLTSIVLMSSTGAPPSSEKRSAFCGKRVNLKAVGHGKTGRIHDRQPAHAHLEGERVGVEVVGFGRKAGAILKHAGEQTRQKHNPAKRQQGAGAQQKDHDLG